MDAFDEVHPRRKEDGPMGLKRWKSIREKKQSNSMKAYSNFLVLELVLQLVVTMFMMKATISVSFLKIDYPRLPINH